MLKKTVILLSLILWPLNLFLNFRHIHLQTQTVFKNDYQGEQLVLRNIHLYPNAIFARVFQNKPRIYFYKYTANFFALTDPNNYFFALHPEPIPGNLNLSKFPFLDIIFFAIGIYYLSRNRYKKVILIILIPGIIILSALSSFEGLDFILYFPISLLIINGISILYAGKRKLFNWVSLIFILFAVPEILRSFYNR